MKAPAGAKSALVVVHSALRDTITTRRSTITISQLSASPVSMCLCIHCTGNNATLNPFGMYRECP
jgi:hypothetical protein